jgi:hypothetical protein
MTGQLQLLQLLQSHRLIGDQHHLSCCGYYSQPKPLIVPLKGLSLSPSAFVMWQHGLLLFVYQHPLTMVQVSIANMHPFMSPPFAASVGQPLASAELKRHSWDANG